MRKQECITFEEAKRLIAELKIKTARQYVDMIRRAELQNVPLNPNRYYKKYWINWYDYLGTKPIGNRAAKYRSFHEAREYVRNLKLSSQKEWEEYYDQGKVPSDIPKYPNMTKQYKTNNKFSWTDWLGHGKIAVMYKSEKFPKYSQLKKLVKLRNVKTVTEYRELYTKYKQALIMPISLKRTYKKQFEGNDKFFGRKRITWYTYNEAKNVVRKIGIKSQAEYIKLSNENKLPIRLPKNPQKTYSYPYSKTRGVVQH